MTPWRPNREPFEAIEVGIRRLRLGGLALVGVAVAVPAIDRPGPIGLGLLVALAGLALVGDRASRRLSLGAEQRGRLVAVQLAIDVLVTVGMLLVLDPAPGDGLWLAVAFPVLEGALRYGILGGASVWLATVVPVAGWTIAGWAPGDGFDSMTQTAGVLSVAIAVGLPAGRAADRLADELEANRQERDEIERQAHLVSVLTVAGQDLAAAGSQELCPILVDASVELGFPEAELVLIDVTTWGNRSLVARPTDFVAPIPTGAELGPALLAPPGSVFEGPSACTFGILANDGQYVTILAVAADDRGRWEPRHEGFALLCRNGAAALAATENQHRIDEAGRTLDHRRSHDPLTGLLNRAGFAGALASVLERLTIGAEARLLLVDLDGFAEVNASKGWAAGDQVLIEIAARLRRTSPKGTAIGRLEGDRFVVATDHATAGYLADHLRDILARPIATPQGPVVVTAAIGQIITGDPEYSPTAALREAELRARASKELAKVKPQLSEEYSL